MYPVKIKKLLLAVVAVMLSLCAVGCSFDTYVKTSKKVEDSINGFFKCVVQGDLKKSSDYLAYNASFDINNQTGYDFTERIMKYRFSKLKWSITQKPVYEGAEAYCHVSVTAPDISSVREYMPEVYSKKEREYLSENSLNQIPDDEQGHDIVDMLMWQTFESLADRAVDETSVIKVNLIYENNAWRMISDNALCEAVFGSNIMQEDNVDGNE